MVKSSHREKLVVGICLMRNTVFNNNMFNEYYYSFKIFPRF